MKSKAMWVCVGSYVLEFDANQNHKCFLHSASTRSSLLYIIIILERDHRSKNQWEMQGSVYVIEKAELSHF